MRQHGGLPALLMCKSLRMPLAVRCTRRACAEVFHQIPDAARSVSAFSRRCEHFNLVSPDSAARPAMIHMSMNHGRSGDPYKPLAVHLLTSGSRRLMLPRRFLLTVQCSKVRGSHTPALLSSSAVTQVLIRVTRDSDGGRSIPQEQCLLREITVSAFQDEGFACRDRSQLGAWQPGHRNFT